MKLINCLMLFVCSGRHRGSERHFSASEAAQVQTGQYAAGGLHRYGATPESLHAHPCPHLGPLSPLSHPWKNHCGAAGNVQPHFVHGEYTFLTNFTSSTSHHQLHLINFTSSTSPHQLHLNNFTLYRQSFFLISNIQLVRKA